MQALDRFKTSPNGVLVATDVAARGLDVKGVDCVIHYQVPAAARAVGDDRSVTTAPSCTWLPCAQLHCCVARPDLVKLLGITESVLYGA